MTDLGKSRSGPKESDNRDKSLHGLMVALAMAGAIAGSAILFAYASSDGSVPAAADTTASEVPEPVIVEEVVEKPVYIERIKYVNRTVEVEKPVYINRTVEVEKEVPVYIEKEVEKPVYIYVDKTEDDSDAPEDKQKDDDLPEEPEQDSISKRVMDLLHRVVDIDDDDESEEKDDDEDDDNEKKGKHHKHDDKDDDEEGDD